MRIEIGDVNPAAEDELPPKQADGSKIGVRYADAYISTIKGETPDGEAISVKRRGLKLTVSIGDKKGEGLMRRLEKGPDPKVILNEALSEAAAAADATFVVEDGKMFLEL